MRDKSSVILTAVISVFALTGMAAVAFSGGSQDPGPIDRPQLVRTSADPVAPSGAEVTGAAWLVAMRPYCNPVDVETRLRWTPAPETADGTMHRAACLALAGRIDSARDQLLTLSDDDQWKGAGVVFNIGHPAADAGDDVAAGPLMELVVEFWPNHYMALYHAGAARFESGDPDAAKEYLERFLDHYDVEDGWLNSARDMLARIDAG